MCRGFESLQVHVDETGYLYEIICFLVCKAFRLHYVMVHRGISEYMEEWIADFNKQYGMGFFENTEMREIMKFKYKKMILVITMCTMCIGLITISLTTPSEKKGFKRENAQNESSFVALSEDATLMNDSGVEEKESDIKENQSQEISNLVSAYFDARLTCDLQTMASLVTEVENIDVVEMQAKQRLIQQYENVECYTVDGVEKGEYLTYVYSEIKFTGIDTAAPGLDRLYIITDDEGNLRVETGAFKTEVEELIEQTDQSEDVLQFINTVNTKLEEAINNDDDLREFYANLNGGSDQVDTEAMEENTGEATDAPMEDTHIVNE